MKIEKSAPDHILKKYYKDDPEETLKDELIKKYGERYLKYRKNYFSIINDDDHKIKTEYPTTVILELVNRCDLQCVMCYQGFRNDAEKFTVDETMLDKIFDDFKKNKLSALMLTASEPLLYKHFDKVLKRAEEAEIMDVFIFTNGNLLNEKNSRLILNSCVTRLFISIDAATEETYNKIRIPVSKRLLEKNRLKKVENNVKNFIKLRNDLNKRLPLTRVSFVALKENTHELELFKSKWENIVDSVEIQRETSIKVYDKIKNYRGDKLKNYNCNRPWADIAIYSNGLVGPCCNLVGRKIPIGNVKDNPIKEIWNGPKMSELRNGFLKNKPNEVCKSCIESQETNI